MRFLCEWLYSHPDIRVELKFDGGSTLFVYMKYDNLIISRAINMFLEKDFMEIRFNEMYNELISKGGSI